VTFFTYSLEWNNYNTDYHLRERGVSMKQAVLKKILVSGITALGVIGLSAPAAFAMGNNSYNYGSSYGNDYSRCYGAQGWNDGNNWNNGCQPIYRQPYRYVNYSSPCNRYGGYYW
jgi:hypothetical protein